MATKKEIEIKLKSTLDGKGVEEAKQKIDSLNKSTDQLDKGSQKATKSIKNMGQSTLQAAYFFDDLQYGIKGILNNIPGLVIGFGGGPSRRSLPRHACRREALRVAFLDGREVS